MDTYIVKKGEQLDDIAKRFGIPVKSIIDANNLENLELVEGQIIQIPVYDTTIFEVYTIKKGDTLYNIAKNLNIDLKVLAAINGLDTTDYIYDNQKIIVPEKGIRLFITEPGDTIRTMLVDKKLNFEDLVYYNNNIYLLPDQLLIHKGRE